MAHMAFVVTLIAGLEGELSEGTVAAAGSALAGAGARTGAPDWLAPGWACDLPYSGLDPSAARAAIRPELQGAALDWAVQATAGRRKALLVADMESTIIGQEMLDELADALGLRDQVAGITARAMAGELDFIRALEQRVALLAGLPATALDEAAGRMTLNPGARRLVATMKANAAHTVLVSGGFDVFADRIAAECGFDEVVANRLEMLDGHLTGRVVPPVVDRAAKLATLERLVRARGLTPAAACAVGDGANDADMLRAAGLGVAYRAKPPARAAADAAIDHGDLTALLYLQGYRGQGYRGGSIAVR